MNNLNDVLNGSEFGLVVEALYALRERKESALMTSQLHPTLPFTEKDFGIPQLDALLKRFKDEPDELDADHEASLPVADSADIAPTPPRVGIRLEGGVIQSIFCNQEVSVVVINYDVEDAAPPEGYEDPDHRVCDLDQGDGTSEECVLIRWEADVLPDEFPRIDSAFAAELEEEESAGARP